MNSVTYKKISLTFLLACIPIFMAPTFAQGATKPDSPVMFRTSSLDSLGDIQKDSSDARIAINNGGMFKLMANVITITVHVGVLESLTPQKKYKSSWSTKLKTLSKAVDRFSSGISDDSVSRSLSNLDAIQRAARDLKALVLSMR